MSWLSLSGCVTEFADKLDVGVRREAPRMAARLFACISRRIAFIGDLEEKEMSY